MEGNHTYEERNNMQMESQWGVEYYRAEKGRGQMLEEKTPSFSGQPCMCIRKVKNL